MLNNIVKQKSNHSLDTVSVQNISSTSMIKNKHYPAVAREWKNNSYRYTKNVTGTTVIDNSTFDLLKVYFNSTPKGSKISKVFKGKSILKVLLGKLRIKNSVNKVAITVPIYNKQKIFFWNLFKKSFQFFKYIAYSKRKVDLATKISRNSKKIKPLMNSFNFDTWRMLLEILVDLSSNLAFFPVDSIKEKFIGLFKKGDSEDETSNEIASSSAPTSSTSGSDDDDDDEEKKDQNKKKTQDQYDLSNDSLKGLIGSDISKLDNWQEDPKEDFYKDCDPNNPDSIKDRQLSALLSYLQIRDSQDDNIESPTNSEESFGSATDNVEDSIPSTDNNIEDSTSSTADKSQDSSKGKGKKRVE